MSTKPITTPARADARTHKSRQPTPQALPFPALPGSKEVGPVNFWLAAWVRDVAAHASFLTFTNSIPVRKARQKFAALSLALTVAEFNAENEIRESAKNLKDAGGLLFAFPSTTKLQQAAA